MLMKNFLFSFLCIICLLVPWMDVGAQTVLYEEGFENGTPTGWAVSGTASSSYNWQVSTRSAHTGSYSYVFDSYNASRGQEGILISAPIAITSSEMVLSFWLKNPKGGALSVYISTDGGTTYRNNPLDTNITNLTDWTEYSYPLNSYVGQSISLVFYSVSNWANGDAYHYLDDVVIREAASCAQPIDFSVVALSQTAATINWTVAEEGDVPSAFILNVYDDGGNYIYNNQSITPTVQGTSFTYALAGLTANTKYNVTLKGDCSANYRGTSAISDIFEFTTLCNSISLPLVDNFNNATTSLKPDCWFIVDAPSTSTAISETQVYGTSGKSFKLQPSQSTSSIVATRQIAHAANDMEVDFMYYAPAGTTLNVGLMSDVSDMSTFEPLYSLEVSDEHHNTWRNYRFVTSNTAQGTVQNLSVVFAVSSGTSSSTYLDNVDIHTIPSCLRLEDLEVTNLDSISVTLNWTNYSATPSGNYVVEIFNVEDSTVNYVNATTSPVTLNNLNDNTTYQFRVRNVCASSDSSQWSLPIMVTTQCKSVKTLPYVENFDSESIIPACWQVLLPGWSIFTGGSSQFTHSGNSLKSPDSQGGHYLIASQAINVPTVNGYDLSFWMYRMQGSSWQYEDERARIWVNNTPSLDGAILLDSIHAHAALYPVEDIFNSGMVQYVYPIPMQGTVYILFETFHAWGTSMYFDDVTVEEHVCKGRVGNLSVVPNFSNNTIKATWNTKTEETQWLVDFMLRDASDTLYNVNDVLVNNMEYVYDFTSFFVNNSNYNYSIRVRALCAGNDTIEPGISIVGTFKTPCSAISLPIVESFEGSEFPPSCWSSYTDPNSTEADNIWETNTYSGYVQTGVKSATFPDARAITIGYLNTAAFYAEAGKDYQISYYQYKYDASSSSILREGITIWLSETPSDTTNAIKLGFESRYDQQDVISSYGMYKYTYEFTVPQNGNYFIIIQATQEYGNANYVDDIMVVEKPRCSNTDVANLSVEGLIDGVEVTVSDTLINTIEFVICSEDVIVPDSIKDTDIHSTFNLTASDRTFTINGLQPETTYNLFYRNVCDATSNEYSAWSLMPITFKTKCAAFIVNDSTEFFDGFETYNQGDYLNEENTCLDVQSNSSFYVKGGLGSNVSSSGTQCVPYAGNNQLAIRYSSNGSIKRALNLKAGKNYEVSVYTRLDKLYPASPECASISLFYHAEDATENVYCLPKTFVTADDWTKYAAYFTVPADGIYYVGMEELQNGAPWYMAFDNFRVREVSCAPPTQAEILNITNNSIDVQITSEGFTTWEVRVCTSLPDITLAAPQAVVVDTITSTSFTINDLQANTDYWYIVRTLCSDRNSDWTTPVHFITSCVEQNVPYTNSFETEVDARCWRNVGNESSVMTLSSTYAKFGESSLKLSEATIVSPKFNVTSLSNYMITGWVYAVQDSASTIDFGVATNPSDISTFELVSSVDIHNSNTWTEFTAYFNVLNDPDYVDFVNAQYITISTGGGHTYYFDNISVEIVPTCPKPATVVAAISGVGEVQLTWDAAATATSYVVATYKGASFVGETVVTSNTATISGLQAVTNYYFTVRAICAANDSSSVSYSNTIKTPCADISLPYFSDFENNLGECWEISSTVENPTSANQRWQFSSYNYNFFAYLASGSGADTAYLVSPTFTLQDNNGIVLELDGYTSSIASNTPILYSLDRGATWDTLQTALFPLTTRSKRKYTMPNIGPGTITFKFVSEYRSAGYLYIFGFNVEEIEDCNRPQTVNTMVSGNSVDVTIVDTVAAHTQWQYVYGVGDIDPNSMTPMVTSSKTFTINDLQLRSNYTLYVRTYCGDSDVSTWYAPYSFTTGCGLVTLPYFEGFEDLNTIYDAFENKCYKFFTTGSNPLTSTSGYPRLNLPLPIEGYGANGSQAVRWVSSAQYPIYLQLPQFELDVNEIELSFNYRNEDIYADENTNIIAGIMIPDNPASFLAVHTCPLQNDIATRVTLDYSQLLPEGDYTGYVVAFKYGEGPVNYYYASVDDITVISKVKCGTSPTATISAITTQSITFALDYFADTLEIGYGLAGTSIENTTRAYTTAYNYTLRNLATSTAYDFYIRNICGGNAGDWVGPYTYSTFCDTIVVTEATPWVEDFDNTGSNRYPQCFFTLTSNEVNGVTYPTVVDTLVSTSPSALAMKGANIISLPLFDQPLSTYRLSFYAKGVGTIYIGTVNDIDAGSFNSLTSVALSSGVNYSDIDLSYFSNIQGNKLAFKTNVGADLFIDSVCVKIKPECFVPRNFAVSSVLDSSIVISFRLSPIAEGFEYMVYNATDTISNTVSGIYSTYKIDGLNPNTSYSVAIRSLCEGASTTDWTDAVSFTTSNTLLGAPFVIDFENDAMNANLQMLNSTSSNKFIIGTDINAVKDGLKALYISNNNSAYGYGINSAASNFVVLPTKFTRGKYVISYDWKCFGESSYDYARIFLAPIDMQFIASTTTISGLSSYEIPEGCYSLDNETRLNDQVTWHRNSVEVTVSMDMAAKIVIFWRNDGSDGDQPPIAIDNFVIEKMACMEGLDSVKVDNITATSASFLAYPNPEIHDSVGYVIYDESGAVVDSAVVNLSGSNSIVINNLNDNTTYTVEFWGYCDGGATAKVTGEITTDCLPYVVDSANPFFEGFESVETFVYFSNVMNCWNDKLIYGSDDLYSLSGTSTNPGYRAYKGVQGFRLYSNTERYISRLFNLQPGSYEISLWAEQSTEVGSTISIKSRLTTEEQENVLVSQTIGNKYEPVVVKYDVAVAGIYEIGFYLNTRNASGYVAIDNISVKMTDLYQPKQIVVTDVATHSAVAKWSTIEDKHSVRVFTNDTILVLDTLLTNGQDTLLIEGLNSATEYLVSVRAVSATNATTDSISALFATLCDIYSYYSNDFDSEVLASRPKCWELEAYTKAGLPYVTNYTQWKVSNVPYLQGRTALAIRNSLIEEGSVNMVYSPEMAIDRPKLLQFDYFNNCANAVGQDDSLVVTIVSNGVESAPILVATAASTNSSWRTFTYDLSAYVGSTVRVKFWTRSHYKLNNQYIAIDNFSVSCVTIGSEYYGFTCPNTNYVGNGFSVPASQLVVGDTTTVTKRVLGLNGDCDTINTIHIYVPQVISAVTLYDTICQGEVYTSELFPNGITRAGRYTASGVSSLGCDSNVILYLTVVDVNSYLTVNLCEGDTYSFGGQTITGAGVYTDTATNSRGCDSITVLTVTYTAKYYEETAYFCEGTPYVWSKNGTSYTVGGRYENRLTNAYGCDSIQVLNLIMLPTNSYVTVELCQGQNYDFFGTTITEAGTYTHTLANTLGCDSIINLTVTTTPAPFTPVSDYVCEGQEYYGYGFTLNDIVSDTVVTRTVKTTEGCDSIVELTLDLIPTAHVAITATINEGETYEFGGNSLSQAGEYEHTYHTALGCDSVVTLTLNVTTPVDNAYALPIVVAPNPVYGGQSTFVNREWTVAEQSGMRVEVLNSVGQVVDVFTPTTFPIEVGGIYTSGVYYIRVTTGTGDIYLGRLVVR